MAAIGSENVEASLMLFSLPSIVPIPQVPRQAGIPTGAIASQMIAGRKEIWIPKFVLEKSIPRKSLAIAIHGIIPILEIAEKLAKPRFHWASNETSRRVLGLFVFILAAVIAFPVIGFNALHATAIFVISLGLAERDGLVILIGVITGVLSLMFVAGSSVSQRLIRTKIGRWLNKLARRIGFKVISSFLNKTGHEFFAKILGFEWSHLLLLWDPEKRSLAGDGITETIRAEPETKPSSPRRPKQRQTGSTAPGRKRANMAQPAAAA